MLRLQIIKFQGGCQGLLDLSQHDATLGKLTNIDLFFMCTRYMGVLSLLFGVDSIAVSLSKMMPNLEELYHLEIF